MGRRLNDFYETAAWQVDALVDHLPELKGVILCPCVGDGSLMRQLAKRRPDLEFYTNDLDPSKGADTNADATLASSWSRSRFDWVVENFPFNVEHLIIPYAYRAARCGVVAMARISYTEPTKARGPWLARHPYQKRITLERHSFTGDGKSDSATTDWLVWAKVPVAGPFGISAYGYRDGSAQRKADAHVTVATKTVAGTCQASAPSGMPAFMYGLPPLPVDITSPVQDAAHAELREFPDEHSR